MRTNKTKAKLLAGGAAISCSVNYPNPHLVELIGAVGYDAAFIDCEHGSIDVTDLEDMVRAAEAFDVTPLARVPENSYSTILRFLDRGIQGILVPHISNRADAAAAVRAAKYWPEGERGSATGGRINDYGTAGRSNREFYQLANKEVLVMALVESREGMEKIDEIASTPGIDVVLVGPSDLSQSLGMPEQKEMDAAIERIVAGTLKAGKVAAVGATSLRNMASIERWLKRGCRYVGIGTDDLVRQGSEQFLKQVRGLK